MWRQMSNIDIEIPFEFYHWGPFLTKMKITENEKQKVLQMGEETRDDFRHSLAGIIKEEYKFSDDNANLFMDTFSKYFKAYMEKLVDYNRQPLLKNVTSLKIGRVWINKMKANEYNPQHIHSGDLSFVMYLSVPDDLKKEREEYIGSSSGPGSITFKYGEHNPTDKYSYFATQQNFLPEERDFFIFPANLTHQVIPFSSDITRISVAGNVYFQNDSI